MIFLSQLNGHALFSSAAWRMVLHHTPSYSCALSVAVTQAQGVAENCVLQMVPLAKQTEVHIGSDQYSAPVNNKNVCSRNSVQITFVSVEWWSQDTLLRLAVIANKASKYNCLQRNSKCSGLSAMLSECQSALASKQIRNKPATNFFFCFSVGTTFLAIHLKHHCYELLVTTLQAFLCNRRK